MSVNNCSADSAIPKFQKKERFVFLSVCYAFQINSLHNTHVNVSKLRWKCLYISSHSIYSVLEYTGVLRRKNIENKFKKIYFYRENIFHMYKVTSSFNFYNFFPWKSIKVLPTTISFLQSGNVRKLTKRACMRFSEEGNCSHGCHNDINLYLSWSENDTLFTR